MTSFLESALQSIKSNPFLKKAKLTWASILEKRSLWIQRFLTVLLICLLLFGSYRIYRWMSPPIPSIYKIGMDATWHPLNLYGKEPAFTAFSSEVMFAVAKDQKLKIEIVRSGPKRVLELLDDSVVDGILSPIFEDHLMEEHYYFSNPYYRFGTVLIVRKDTSFTELKEFSHKRVTVQRGSPILYRITVDPSTSVVTYNSPLTALDELGRSEVDGVFMDLLEYLYYGGMYRDKLKVVTHPLTNPGLRLITLQEDYGWDLIEKFNAGLENIKQNGVYQKLLEKWDLYNPEKVE